MIQIPDIRTLLGTIPWALVGGIALRAYAPERDTRDVDVLIHERDRERARAVLLAAGYQPAPVLPSPAGGRGAGGEGGTGAVPKNENTTGFTVAPAEPTGMPIDVITRADRWLDAALAAPAHDLAGYPVLARPYLMLLKLQTGRSQDLSDVQRVLGGTPADARVAIRALVQRERPDLLEDYDSLAMLADLEYGSPAAPPAGQSES